MHLRSLLIVGATTVVLAACTYGTPGAGSQAAGNAVTLTVAHTSAGDTLAGAGGMTLYINTAEQGGQIACEGSCATAWPPLIGSATAGSGVSGTLGSITRPDGSVQVTYGGMPLYYFASDAAAGDVKGQGLGGIWYIASPAGSGGASGTPSSTPYEVRGY